MTDTALASSGRVPFDARTNDARASAFPALPVPSATSWGAILAGAAGAAALSLILLILGTGLGLSSVSPFSGEGVGATGLGISTILWITFTQLAASAIGGYLAGRLRTRWAATHVDEIYFRDTAHGFIAWAVATLVTAAVLTSAIGTIVGNGARAAAAAAGGAATAAAPALASAAHADASPDNAYFVDTLFRKDPATPAPANPGDAARTSAEATRILASALRGGTLPPEDAHYLGQLVSQSTGIAPADADKRVAEDFARMKASADEAAAQAREAADKARKASAYAALWLFISLLAGAFVASAAATFGGRQRDLA